MKATQLPSTGIRPGDWAPCSDRSRERADPLAGTGGYGERWLLVEIDGSWGEHAFLDSLVDPEVGRAIVRRAEDARMRPVAIRRFGRRADERRADAPLRWAVVDARSGLESVRWGEARSYDELLALPLDGSTGTPSSAPVFLVCTHARHDQCCAVRGRPVASALAEAFPDETWESSHLGGDRFAATMILFPHGLYYGRVPAEGAVDVARAYVRGEVVPELLRGRSSLTNVAQAAQAVARLETGDLGVDALTPLVERREGDRWTVELDAGGRMLTVELAETLSEPLFSTCGAWVAAPVRQFEPLGVTVPSS